MYTEEVGVDPEADGGATIYRSRVRQLIGLGWSFARIEDDRVVFKAEVAHATPQAAQIQGVWVAPDRRGEGLAARGVAAVAEACRRDIAPVVSLYANVWNEPALPGLRAGGLRADRAPSPPSCSDRAAAREERARGVGEVRLSEPTAEPAKP